MTIQHDISKEVYELCDIATAELRELADKVQNAGDPSGMFDDYLHTLAADIQALGDQLETLCDEDTIIDDLDDIAALDETA